MTHSDGTSAEWTVSRIMRLLRPLKSKCVSLSTYMKETSVGSVAAYTGHRVGQEQELLPINVPPDIGIRIHFSPDTVRTMELSKKIYAIRDCYCDILSKDKSLVAGVSSTRACLSLSSLCSVILGAQISSNAEETEETADADIDIPEILYEAIPPQYRSRTLLMHALHIILDFCPPSVSLYLSLFDVTLDRQLYHESEVLLEAILEYAFETSQTNAPRISNPAYRRFLVDLYSDWSLRFPSHSFVRLVTKALQRAASDIVWTSKATRRLVRKLVRYDTNGLPILLTGIMGVISPHKKARRPTQHLESQLREWFYLCVEISMTSMTSSGALISVADEAFVQSILESYRFCLCRSDSGNFEAVTADGFIDAIACLYSLWLTSGTRIITKGDLLSTHIRGFIPPSSTFAPICSHVLRTSSPNDSEDIFREFASTFRENKFPRLEASLWACALHHIEEPEIEHVLVGNYGREVVRSFKMRLVQYVDRAEKTCFSAPFRAASPHGANIREDLEILCDSEVQSSRQEWCWEASVGCWFRREGSNQGSIPATPKRRRITRNSYPFSHILSPSETFIRRASSSMAELRSGKDRETYLSPSDDYFSPAAPGDVQSAPREFFSLLTSALTSRTNLRGEPEYSTGHISNGRKAVVTIEKGLDAKGIDGSDTDSDGSSWGLGNSDLGEHTLSEDHLDSFKIANTSPLMNK